MDFIEKLRIKPKQENKTSYNFNLKKEAVKVVATKRPPENLKSPDAKIVESRPVVTKQKGFFVDKTQIGFNRNDFILQIKNKRKVRNLAPAKEKTVQPKKVRLVSPTRTIFRFIKKINKKVKLKGKAKKQPRKPRKKTGVRNQKEIPIPEGMVSITEFEDRLYEKPEPIKLRYSSYYLNNREIFVNYINSFFSNYKKQLEGAEEVTCESIARSKRFGEFSLLTHQMVVKDYINVKTPYRGLLLYHGLGAGKTCGSIAIAEGLKTTKKIIIMAPASLIPNYIGELKFCGDPIYKLKHFWEFIPTERNIVKEKQFSQILSISRNFIRKAGGAWLVNKNERKSNFNTLSSNEKESLNKQINAMIESKYQFIAYNGYRMSHLESDSDNFTKNPFDNKVIIVDEAHNLVSRIVNKIKNKESLSYKLYDYLMSAQNCKIILLTGTPIINYPNEIGILFNIIRGYIKTFKIKVNVRTSKTVNLTKMKELLKHIRLTDYIDYSPQTKILTLTRNPFGFVNDDKAKYKGVKLDEMGNLSDSDYIERVRRALFSPRGEDDEFIVFNKENVEIENYKALPDTFDEFNTLFKNPDNTVKNPDLFKRRIIGLTSYFRSAQEALMPQFDIHKNLHVINIDMSDHQLGIYQMARDSERSRDKKNARKKKKAANNPDGLYEQTTSTYRIFSRAFCNFVFPNVIERPMPKRDMNLKKNIKDKDIDESDFDAVPAERKAIDIEGKFDIDDLDEIQRSRTENTDEGYDDRIKRAINELRARGDEFLNIDHLQQYSPKFLEIYNNIVNKRGLHLVYSQFKTLEGIGIFKLVLEANGFAELKLKKEKNIYQLDISEADKGKPMFASYTGDEEVEEKEILRWIFNSEWDKIPKNIKDDLEKISTNNYYGEIVKVFMITASGAEGITLKNTRYVHIMEPYWHPVRVEQVIGRARRICSHEALEDDEKKVDVYIYLSVFSEEQMKTDGKVSQELKVNDLSQLDGKTVMTTDQYMWEISQIKESINKNILLEVKESSIDCSIHNKASNPEKLKCYSFGKVGPNNYNSLPNIEDESKDSVSKMNKRKKIWDGKKVKIGSTIYTAKLPALSDGRIEIYDYESFRYVQKYGIGNTVFVGHYDPKTKRLIEVND